MGRIVFAAMVIGGLVLSSICFGYSGGSGTAEDPYQIADANDLLALAADTSNYDKCFILTADVNLEGQVFTTAIIAADTDPANDGFQGTAFTGTFDGNSHKITNFAIDGGSNDYLGLFGQIDAGGAVKNLGIENFAVSGFRYVGGLVGLNYGSISNCYSTGAVSSSGSSNSVGGLVGLNYDGSISDCYATGAVSGSDYVGGLVGFNFLGSISDCYSTGTASGSGSYYVGGLVGWNCYGSISDCYATGAVSGHAYVGGLVGENDSSISNCFSTGTVTGGDQSVNLGGLVGYSSGSINNCYSTGAVSGTYDVGGLAGMNNEGGSIGNCYSTGSVSGSSGSQCVGGLVGFNEGSSIINCYSTGAVSGSSYAIGGLVGYKYASVISSSFWDVNTSGWMTSAGGTGLSTAQMKQQASFVGWDFTNETANGTNDYWRMCIDGVDYPRLNWESIAGDFACPDGVNIEDLDYFVQRWLLGDCASSNNCDGTDMNTDGTVNFIDFALFAQNWLEM